MSLYYFIISLISSTVGAISGIGGGVIIKPVLDNISHLGTPTISFLSGNTVLAMTTVTLIRGRKYNLTVDKKVSTLIAFGSIVGGIVGKSIFDHVKTINENSIPVGAYQSSILFLLAILVIGFYIYKDKIKPIRHNRGILLSIISGFFLGGIASFLGIGGGPLNLAVLYLLFSMESKIAALNSIYIIFFSQLSNLIFSIATHSIPEFNGSFLMLMVLGGVLGGFLGTYFSSKMSNRGVDKIFVGILIGISILCINNIMTLL